MGRKRRRRETFRTQRGSRLGLMLGANSHMEPAPALYIARASSPITPPTRRHSSVSNAAPSAIGQGKLVGQPVLSDVALGARQPVSTPWRPSPLGRAGTASRGMAGDEESRAAVFSAKVMRDIKSAMRLSSGCEALQ
jgi:hypothetical protein